MKSERALIIIGFVVISIIWGSTWLAIKVGLDSVPPLFGVALRFSVALIVLFILMKIRGQRVEFDARSLKVYAILAVFSFSFPFALVYWGEQYIASGLASILFGVYPFVVALWSQFLLPDEPLTVYKTSGIVLGFSGILVIFWSDFFIGESSALGMLAVVASTFLQGMALVMVKRTAKHLHPVPMNVGGMMFSVLISYTLAFFFENPSDIRFDAKGLGSILYLATFGTSVTFVVYYWLLKKVEAVYLSLVSFVTPVLAVILGAAWLGESLSPRVFTGASLVLLGILAANAPELLRTLGLVREVVEE